MSFRFENGKNAMSRLEVMRDLLLRGRYFKLVCGAGNEDKENVRRLAVVYTLAGANGFDVSATPAVVKACVDGIDLAYQLAGGLNRKIPLRPFITVSVGMPGDHHVRKAYIVDDCVECGKCLPVCPTDAIPDTYEIIREKCIGCGMCEAVCPPKVAAVRYEHNNRALDELLPACLEAGAENIELHAAVPDDESIMEEWKLVNRVQPNHFVSMCLDRSHLSNTHLISRIIEAQEIAGSRLIIQADGVPMGGTDNSFGTTLQTVAIASAIQKNLIEVNKAYRDLPILLSGGTNDKTAELARLCGVSWAGIAIGTHARNLVKPFVSHEAFDTNIENMAQAVAVAESLVQGTMRA